MKISTFLFLILFSISLLAQDQTGFWDLGNSTTKALNNGESFTGAAIPVSGYSSLVVAALTDQDGKLYVQFSPDKSNWDSTLTYNVTASSNEVHELAITRPYMRVKFTNDSGSNQSYLRLTTLIGQKEKLTSILSSTIQQDADARVVRPSDFRYEVAQGRWQNHTLWNKFAYNGDLDTGTELVAVFGGSFTYLTSASTLTIVSDSIADDGDPAGTGANSIVIYGIDANRTAQTEIVTLNGTTNVVTSTTWLGINRVALYLSGSGQVNAGNISITATTGGSTQGYIAAGEGVTQQAIFFTQASHTLVADWLAINVVKLAGGSAPRVTVKGLVYSALTNSKYEVFRTDIDTAVENHIPLNPSQPFVIGEKSVLWFEATTNTDNTIINVRFSGVEIKN